MLDPFYPRIRADASLERLALALDLPRDLLNFSVGQQRTIGRKALANLRCFIELTEHAQPVRDVILTFPLDCTRFLVSSGLWPGTAFL